MTGLKTLKNLAQLFMTLRKRKKEVIREADGVILKLLWQPEEVLVANDVTGVGLIDDIAIPFIVFGAMRLIL